MKEYYSPADFIKSKKYDAHMHYHIIDDVFVRMLMKANIHLLTINTNLGDLPIDKQFEISQSLHQRYPQFFNFIGTFDASVFTSKTFVEDTVEQIRKCRAAGARGVKIWKNIGMTLKNEAGQYVMADDPVFAPIFDFLEKEKIPLLAHLGEPRNCWLPLELMTVYSERQYFSNNPNFHMYRHPEAPSYEQQIEVRDRLLERYPDLIFVGAHLGSMEWNLDEVAKRMDRFPNFYVDISGRFAHIFEQTLQNRNRVIDFFQTYQNRILYGSDRFLSLYNERKWMNLFCKCFPQFYIYLLFRHTYGIIKNQWLFLSTDKMIKVEGMKSHKHVKGLKLEKSMIDRIFYENVRSVYF